MMKRLFFPEFIYKKRLLSRRIVSIHLQNNSLVAVFVVASQERFTIEKIHEIPLFQSEEISAQEALLKALQALALLFKKDDEVRLVISSDMAVFKEMTLPFVDPEKIRMVLDFEIESLLPFALEDAVIDFIVTQINEKEKTSTILAVAMRKHDIAEYIDICKNAGFEPDVITVDLIAFYSLYKQISVYSEQEKISAFVDMSHNQTRITFLQEGVLKLTRQIPYGLDSLITKIADETKLSVIDVKKILTTTGFSPVQGQDSLVNAVLQKELSYFFNEIQFTLNAFSLKLNSYESVQTLFFLGQAAQVYQFVQSCADITQMKCVLFDPRKILDSKKVKETLQQFPPYWDMYGVALGAVISSYDFFNFNMRRKELELFDYKLFIKQLVAGFFVLAAIIATVLMHGYMQLSVLEKKAKQEERLQILKLGKFLPKNKTVGALKSLLKISNERLDMKRGAIAPLVLGAVCPLPFLLEITRLFDKRQFSITIDEIVFSERARGDFVLKVEGCFKSDRGFGNNWKDWEEPKKRLRESEILELIAEPVATPAQEGGVRFSVLMQKKKIDPAMQLQEDVANVQKRETLQ